jgi:glycosyltransferase involved in cell wall biosynthesis
MEPGTADPVKPRESIIDSCNPLAWITAREALEDMGLDRLVIQWWHPFFAPALLASLPGHIPSAAICHNVVPHESFPLSGSLARRFLSRMELSVVHSESDLREAEKLELQGRIMRLYHPVYDQYRNPEINREKARIRLGYSRETRLILFFGLVRSYKGVQDLVRAMSSLPDDVQLLIVGECYSDRREIMDTINSLDLSRRIRWIDRFVPDNEVAVYFQAADVVALPYRHATQSGVAQIAISFGKVLVLTETGGLGELVDSGSTGYLAQPWSPVSLSESIIASFGLLTDPRTESRVMKKAAEFSWERYARNILEALR